MKLFYLSEFDASQSQVITKGNLSLTDTYAVFMSDSPITLMAFVCDLYVHMTDRLTDKHIDRQMERQTDKRMDGWTDKQEDRQTD